MIQFWGMTPNAISDCSCDMGHRKEPSVYSDFVAGILKPGSEILKQLTPEDCNLIHMAMLVTGEAGELCDAIKKPTIYRKTINLENVKEEMGDLEFALQAIRTHFGWTREEILAGNVEKLSKRYPSGRYSNEQAINRADKA